MSQAKFFKDDPEFLKYGYYQVDQFRTLSKFEAWQFATKNNMPIDQIVYNYNDEKFAKFDWTVEPTKSIDELYRDRALELRQKYDYIVMIYSGGIDSYVALQTFIDNNIKVDEIVVYSNCFSEFFNKEPMAKAVPHAQSLELEKLGTRFSLIDIGPKLQDQFTDQRHLNDYFYTVNGLVNPWSYYIRSGKAKLDNFPHHIELSKRNKQVCYIYGLDKPNLMIENDHYVFRYVDGTPDLGVKNFINKTIYGSDLANVHDEGFFLSMDSPEIVIKQAHMLATKLNTIVSRNHPQLVGVTALKSGDTSVVFEDDADIEQSRFLGKLAQHQTYYPTAPHERFADDKVYGSSLYTKRDSWFFRQQSAVRNSAVAYCKRMLRENDGYFKYTNDDVPNTPFSILGQAGYQIKKKHRGQ